jgi:hypothetical protein
VVGRRKRVSVSSAIERAASGLCAWTFSSAESDILESGEMGKEVEGLENDAELLAMSAEMFFAGKIDRFQPSRATVPESEFPAGDDTSSVLFPPPDGPMNTTERASPKSAETLSTTVLPIKRL